MTNNEMKVLDQILKPEDNFNEITVVCDTKLNSLSEEDMSILACMIAKRLDEKMDEQTKHCVESSGLFTEPAKHDERRRKNARDLIKE